MTNLGNSHQDGHRAGVMTRVENSSCHAAPIENLDKEEKVRLMEDTSGDIQVMRVLMANLPQALSLEVLKEVAEQDKVYQRPQPCSVIHF